MSLRTAVGALVVALALAGCGGGSDNASSVGADSAATIAPATSALYASINTDVESDEWEQLNELLDKFPGKARLLAEIEKLLRAEGLSAEELRAAAGPTVEVVALELEGEDDVVGLAQPKDEAKFRALLDKSDDPIVVREIEDWTAFAATAGALDRFESERADGTLADDEVFAELMGELPDEALVKAWFDTDKATEAAGQELGGGSIQSLGIGDPQGVSLAVEAEDDGLRVSVHYRNDEVTVEGRDFGELGEQVPSDAFAFLNFHGQDGQLKVTEALRGLRAFGGTVGEAERMIGVTLEDISTLFNKEFVLWVRPGAIIPEVTLVLEVDDEAEAHSTVDRLVSAAGALGTVERTERKVGDIDATELDLGQFAILYAAFDGKLVLTTQASGIEALTEDTDRLVDEGRYEDSLESAGVADGENVILWVDLARTLDVVDTFAALQGSPIPPDVRANIEPLESVVFSAEPSFEDGSMRLFLHVR